MEELTEEEVYEEEEEIDFCDEEQIERGRVKIYEKIVLAQRKIEEAKRALQQLTHECFVANEELEAFNTKVEQNRVRDLSEQHLVDAPNFIPLLHPKSISELLFYSDSDDEFEVLGSPNFVTSPVPSPVLKLRCPSNHEDDDEIIAILEQAEDVPTVALIEPLTEKEGAIILSASDDESCVSSDSSDSSLNSLNKSFSALSIRQKKPRANIKRRGLGEVLEVGDKMIYKRDEKLTGTWNGRALVFNGEEYFKLSKLNRAHQSRLGRVHSLNVWDYYSIQRKNGEVEKSLDLFIIKE